MCQYIWCGVVWIQDFIFQVYNFTISELALTKHLWLPTNYMLIADFDFEVQICMICIFLFSPSFFECTHRYTQVHFLCNLNFSQLIFLSMFPTRNPFYLNEFHDDHLYGFLPELNWNQLLELMYCCRKGNFLNCACL